MYDHLYLVTTILLGCCGAGEEMEVAAAGERGYHGNELQHGLKMFFGSFHSPADWFGRVQAALAVIPPSLARTAPGIERRAILCK